MEQQPDIVEGFSEKEEPAKAEKRRPAELFLADFFKTEKCRVRRVDKKVLEVSLTPELAAEFGKEKLLLCFDRKLMEQFPEADLAIVGSRPYDQVIALCRRRGTFSVQYARRDHDWKGFEALAEPVVFANAKPRVEAGKEEYQAVLIFNFGISYRSVVASDELVTLAYDAGFGRVTADVDFYLSRWLDFAARKPLDLSRVEAPPIEEVFPIVCRALDQKIRRKVQKIKRQSRRLLQQEIQKVESYYRQLIAEEKQNRERRNRLQGRAAAENGDRIEIYQLDWKRRIAEETKHYEPSVALRLVSLGKVYVPRTPLRLLLEGDLEPDKRLVMNHATGQVEGLTCDLCDAPMSEVYAGEDGRLLCRGCNEDWPAGAGDVPGAHSPKREEEDRRE